MKYTKRMLIVMMAALLLVLCACGGSPVPAQSGAPAPSAAPVEAKTAVFVVSDGSEAGLQDFLGGISAVAEANGWQIESKAAGSGFDAAVKGAECDAIIALVSSADTEPDALNAAILDGKQVVVMSTVDFKAPSGASAIVYDGTKALELVMENALAYPPHDTPVRMLGMFENEESDGAALFAENVDAGKIFSRGTYSADDKEQTAEEWLAAMTDKYVAGMIDCIFAENADLGMKAFNALDALGRSERLEVFANGYSGELLAAQQKNAVIMPLVIGPDMEAAGKAAADEAASLLDGGEAKAQNAEAAVIGEIKE